MSNIIKILERQNQNAIESCKDERDSTIVYALSKKSEVSLADLYKKLVNPKTNKFRENMTFLFDPRLFLTAKVMDFEASLIRIEDGALLKVDESFLYFVPVETFGRSYISNTKNPGVRIQLADTHIAQYDLEERILRLRIEHECKMRYDCYIEIFKEDQTKIWYIPEETIFPNLKDFNQYSP